MGQMFENCKTLQSIPLFNTSNVDNMVRMFSECSKLQTIPKLDTSKVTSMSSMFYGCEKFNCDLSKWNINRVDKYMSSMFKGAGMKKLPKWYENS